MGRVCCCCHRSCFGCRRPPGLGEAWAISLALTFEVLHELAPAGYSARGTDIVKAPDNRCGGWSYAL